MDDLGPAACVYLLDGEELDGALEGVATLKERRGGTRSLLAVEGIVLLRASRMDEARSHWIDYWKKALDDGGFSEQPSLKLFRGNPADGGFPVTHRHDDFRYDAIRPSFCVYTALFGEYDTLPEPLYRPPGIDFVCLSDRPRDASGWDVLIVDPGTGDPFLDSRRPKILPHEYLSAHDYSLYVDANCQFLGDPVLLYHHWLRGKRFVAWRHPARSDIYAECEAILSGLKCEPAPTVAEYEFYRGEDVPGDTGMLEASFLWRSHRDGEVRELMERWWAHVIGFGGRDQPGLAYWTWKTGTLPEVMPTHVGTSRENDFYVKRPHNTTTIELERAGRTPSKPFDVDGRVHASKRVDSTNRMGGRLARRMAWIYRQEFRSRASTILRGQQLSEIARLNLEGDVEVTYADESEMDRLAGSIVVLTKGVLMRAAREKLDALRSAGNVVCADFVDQPVRDELDEAIDVYIASSIRQLVELSRSYPDKLVHLISHHTDLRITGPAAQKDRCNIGYFGEMPNVLYSKQLQGVVDFCEVDTWNAVRTDWMRQLRHFNVHYAVRRPRHIDGHKPFLKGFTAARCNANIIVGLNEGDARYYLGSDYPYLVKNDSLRSVLETIDYVKDSFGGPEWNRGLEIMHSVRGRCSPTQIAGEVRELVAQLS